MKKSQENTQQDQLEESLPSFLSLEDKVFKEVGGTIYLGREKITPELRSILKDQAKYMQTSQLWEILNASVVNEAYTIALIQSKDFDQVLSAKMLHHWQHFLKNIIHTLAK